MAIILDYNVHKKSGWIGWGNGFTGYNNIGPTGDASSNNYRTVIKVQLEEIDGTYKRDKLDLSLTLYTSSSNLYTPQNEQLVAAVSTTFDSNTYHPPAGAIYSTIYPRVYKDQNYDVNWSIDISGLPKQQTIIYIYVYSALANIASTGYCTSKIKAASVRDTKVLVLSNVTTGAVTFNSTIYKPGDFVYAQWSPCTAGTNNDIDHINIYYRIGSVPTNLQPGYTISNSASGATTFTSFTLPASAPEGEDIYVAIEAIGKASGYNGSLNYSKVGQVNNVPKAPSVSQFGTEVTNSSTVTFTIAKGTDWDTSQSTSLYYRINNGSLQSLNGTTLTISTATTTSGIASGTNVIHFYTYDGLQYSNPASRTIEVIYAPVLNSATIDYSGYLVRNGYNNQATLAKGGIISYTLARDAANSVPIFYLRTSSTSSGLSSAAYSQKALNYSIDNSTKKITLDFMESTNITAGHYFQIRIAIQNSYGTSGFIELASGQKPAKPVAVSFINLTTDGTPRAKFNYFNNNVTISFKNPSADITRPDIASIKIYADSKEFTCSNIAEGVNPSVTLDLSTISRNKTINFSVELTDAAGQKVSSNVSTALTRTSEIKFEGTEWQVNLTTFKPYTTSINLELSPTTATATGTNSTDIIYLYKIKINNIERSLSFKQTSYEDFRNLVNDVIPEDARNTSYTGIITVTAVDGFGVSVSLPQKNITIDYVEAPTFVNSYGIKIRHNQYIDSININTATEITTGMDQNAAARMFSQEEKIILMLPKASDYNSDITRYNIYISRNNIPDTLTVPKDNNAVTYEEAPWLSLTPNQLKEFDENYLYYCHSASQYSDNKYYYFKLVVEDSKSNKTEARYSNTYIIGCRATKPTFSTGLINSTRTKDKSQITINYKDFLITDLGGSAPASGWNFNYYNKYPNITKATLLIEVGPNASFSDQVKSEPLEIDLTNLKIKNKKEYKTTFSGIDTWGKVYIRFTVTIEYAKINSTTSKTITSDSFIDSYVGEIPTVSHRSHWVGINTNVPNSEEVFVIESYSGNKKIVLRYASTGKTITIDLETLAIDGAVIGGGSW